MIFFTADYRGLTADFFKRPVLTDQSPETIERSKANSGQGWKCVNRDIFVIIQDGFRLRESERHLPAASDLPLSPDHFLH